MRVALGLVFLAGLFIPNCIIANSEEVKDELKPELSLRLQPENLVDGVPQAFTFVLTNVGAEDVHLPLPDIDCSNRSPQGSVWLDESWQPSTGATGLAKGKGYCDFGSAGRPEPTVIERAKEWTLLKPGESTYITASAANLHYETAQPGIYEFSGTYVPPLLTKEQLQLLRSVGINVPYHETKSASLQYLKSSR